MPKLRIVLADDHTLVRHGLRKVLRISPTGKSWVRPTMDARPSGSFKT